MTRLGLVPLLATCLVGFPFWWVAAGVAPSPRSGCCPQVDARIDLSSLCILREEGVQDQLGLSAGQKVEIGRHLAQILDPDQEDLIQMILGQYDADRGRLRELEDPGFGDDEEGPEFERPRLRTMTEEFPVRTAAMVDRVLSPEQRAALGGRRGTPDPDALARSLTALRTDNLNGIAAALTPSQLDRLRQLAIEAEGPLAVVRPEIAARLNLSRGQQAQVQAIWDACQADLKHLRGPSPVSPAYREGDDLEVWMRPRLSTIRIESARILADAGRKISGVFAGARP